MTEATETAVAEIVERLREDNDWLMRSRLVGHEIRALQAGNNILRAATALEAEHAARVKAEGERDEADRRAGAAERANVSLIDTQRTQQQWMDERKTELGYGPYESFDRVWADTLAKAKTAEAAERDNAQLREALQFYANPGNHKCGDVFTDFGKRARALQGEPS